MTQPIIGYPVDEHYQQIWFHPAFLKLGYCDAPAVIWQRTGDIITRTYKPEYHRPSGKPNAPPMIWRLTDEWDRGCRLGVWPD